MFSNYLVIQENLKILKKLNKKDKDATNHCTLLSVYRKGIMHKINTRPNQSNRFIHSVKYDSLSLEEFKQNLKNSQPISHDSVNFCGFSIHGLKLLLLTAI